MDRNTGRLSRNGYELVRISATASCKIVWRNAGSIPADSTQFMKQVEIEIKVKLTLEVEESTDAIVQRNAEFAVKRALDKQVSIDEALPDNYEIIFLSVE
jgi:hypothetical protein